MQTKLKCRQLISVERAIQSVETVTTICIVRAYIDVSDTGLKKITILLQGKTVSANALVTDLFNIFLRNVFQARKILMIWNCYPVWHSYIL